MRGDNHGQVNQSQGCAICQGVLFDLLGFSADTETAVEILEGRFNPSDDMDEPTQLLFEEMGRIWKKMESGEVDIVITADYFQHYWRRAKEKTLSSYSKLHFGHYKAAAKSDLLSKVQALKMSLITKTGSAPER